MSRREHELKIWPRSHTMTDQPKRYQRGSHTMELSEKLLRPVIDIMGYRLEVIIEAIAKSIPDKCPNCGCAIELGVKEEKDK